MAPPNAGLDAMHHPLHEGSHSRSKRPLERDMYCMDRKKAASDSVVDYDGARSVRSSSSESFYTTDEDEDEGFTSEEDASPPRRTSSGSHGSSAAPRRWEVAEDQRLTAAVRTHGEAHWKAIALEVGSRNHVQCLQRWKKVLRPGLVKGQWSPEEDAVLTNLAKSGFKNWGQLALHMPGRTSKQCRERWCHHLDPSINKGEYTEEEDSAIMEMQAKLGNKWSQIAAGLPGRTENAIKIRWKALQRRGPSASTSTSTSASKPASPPAGTPKKRSAARSPCTRHPPARPSTQAAPTGRRAQTRSSTASLATTPAPGLDVQAAPMSPLDMSALDLAAKQLAVGDGPRCPGPGHRPSLVLHKDFPSHFYPSLPGAPAYPPKKELMAEVKPELGAVAAQSRPERAMSPAHAGAAAAAAVAATAAMGMGVGAAKQELYSAANRQAASPQVQGPAAAGAPWLAALTVPAGASLEDSGSDGDDDDDPLSALSDEEVDDLTASCAGESGLLSRVTEGESEDAEEEEEQARSGAGASADSPAAPVRACCSFLDLPGAGMVVGDLPPLAEDFSMMGAPGW